MLLPREVRENLVMALDEYFETENDDPDAEELARAFVKLLEVAAEDADLDEVDELILAIEEEAELDDPLHDVLSYEFGKHDDLELAGEEVVRFVEKLGILEWEDSEDMMDELDDLDLDDSEGLFDEADDSCFLRRALRWSGAALLLLAPLSLLADDAQEVPLLRLAEGELQRVMGALADEDEPPYQLAYGVTDRHSLHIIATMGVLGGVSEDRGRQADVDVRVGSMELDNTHKLKDASWFSQELRSSATLPLVDDPLAIRTILWRETDDAWRAAVRRLTKVRANAAVKVEREDDAPDFSPAEPQVDLRAPSDIALDRVAWEATLREVSAVFIDHPDILDSRVTLDAEYALNIFVSSEGHRLQHPRLRYRVAIQATTIADDGMELSVYDYVDAATIEGLPDREALLQRAEAAARHLEALRAAPVIDPFTGPAILRGRAAGVFFHEVFGHRIEGHRQKDEDEGQTFTDMIGEAILPSFLSVVDDPTLARVGAVDLNGHYAYDDEGVPAQAVQLVQDGVLETFLLSPLPVKGFSASNGHGRRQPGNSVVARQGNLIVQASETVPYEALRARLLEEIEAQGKPYGLIVDDITGGFTLTGRVMPNSFNVRPVSVWRVYPDGRPDELVRGGDLIGTPLTTFSRILAAGDDVDVFNGSCGAESGWVPVSAVSPSLLLQEIEVQRKETGNDRPPAAARALHAPKTAEVR